LAAPLLLLVGCSGSDDGGSRASLPASPTLINSADLQPQTDVAYAVDWSADGATIAVSAGVELVLLYSDLTEIATVEPAGGAIGTAVIADGLRYATVAGLHNSKISVWSWNAETYLSWTHELNSGEDQFAVAWSPDERVLASLAGDRESTIQIWDTTTWVLIGDYAIPYANSRRALNWSADSTLVYDAGEIDGEAGYFSIDIRTGEVRELGRLPVEQVVAFAVSADESRIAVADADGRVRVLDMDSGAVLTEFQAVADPVDLAWDPLDDNLAVLSNNATLQVWSLG